VRQSSPTYFVTIVTADRKRVFQVRDNALLLRETLFHYRDEKRFSLHPFVIMPDHLHALITPSAEQSLERCVQCIKGGFSHSMRAKTGYKGDLWQRGFHEHRIRDGDDFLQHCTYIADNPTAPDYEFLEMEGPALDPMPVALSG
jgi:putative transposase